MLFSGIVVTHPISLSERLSALRPTSINAIQAEIRECEAQGKTVLRLVRGEPDFRTPAHVIEACTRALAAGRTGYPDNRGESTFRDAIALKLQRDNGLRYDPATEIIGTTGATSGIYAALTAVLREGDEVMLPDPVYDAYNSPVLLCGGAIRRVRTQSVNGRFGLSEEALEAAWTPAVRVLMINTPWNPVGTVLTRAELEGIGRFCIRRDVVLLTDEIYEAILFDGAKHISALAAVPELRERAVLINGLSKTYAMTGWRVGYCAGPAALIDAMLMVLAQSSRGAATFIQDAAAVALSGPRDCVEEMRLEYARRREHVIASLQDIPGVRPMAPEGGFFAMIDARGLGLPSIDLRRRLMNEHGIAVVHGSVYGPGAEGMLRVSFGSGGKVLEMGLAALREGLIRIGEAVQ